jgi:hypothetical protein
MHRVARVERGQFEVRVRRLITVTPASGVAEWLNGYVRAGCSHLVLRFTGEHERNLETIAGLREKIV